MLLVFIVARTVSIWKCLCFLYVYICFPSSLIIVDDVWYAYFWTLIWNYLLRSTWLLNLHKVGSFLINCWRPYMCVSRSFVTVVLISRPTRSTRLGLTATLSNRAKCSWTKIIMAGPFKWFIATMANTHHLFFFLLFIDVCFFDVSVFCYMLRSQYLCLLSVKIWMFVYICV